MMITRRTFVRGLMATSGMAATGASILAYGADTHDIEQKTVRLSLGLGSPLRLVTLGDIHFDPLYDELYLEEVVRQLTALKADLVVFTGDFITYKLSRMHDLARLLGRAEARLGLLAILGNHDMWWGTERVARELENNGIRVLRNSSYELPGEKDFFLTGLESYWGGKPDPSVVSQTATSARHILLIHEPDPFAHLNDPRIKLQISGHTHGGQIRAPWIGAVRLPKYGQKFPQGLYNRDDRLLYVNRGVGTLKPHIRFDCRPEITVFELT